MAHEQEQDPLQAALIGAFTQAVSLASSTGSLPGASPSSVPVPTTLSAAPSGESAASGSDESWKDEYEARLAQWRAESAHAREKAEQTRAQYEAIRAREQEQAKAEAEGGSSDAGLEQSRKDSSWESVDHPVGERVPLAHSLGTPGNEKVSTADARDLVTGESPRATDSLARSPPTSFSHQSDIEDGSQSRWEDIPSSLGSSFPSLPSDPSPKHGEDASRQASGVSGVSPKRSDRPASKGPENHGRTAATGPAQTGGTSNQVRTTPAVTPIIFSSDVPVKTRALALLSSLAINMFLPFVNGVMLGFGEIFARNVIGPWIGWKSVLNPNGTPTLERTRHSSDSRWTSKRDELKRK